MSLTDAGFKRTAALDLANHFDDRLAQVAGDFIDRCVEIDLDPQESTMLAFAVLSQYAAGAGLALHITEAEYLALCRQHYRIVANAR